MDALDTLCEHFWVKVFSLLCFVLLSFHATAEDWTTLDGQIYKNVKVGRHDPHSVTIQSSKGNAVLTISLLPPDLQKRFDYDPVNDLLFELGGEPSSDWRKINDECLQRWIQVVEDRTTSARAPYQMNFERVNQKRLEILHSMLGDKTVTSSEIKKWVDFVMSGGVVNGMPKSLVLVTWGPPERIVKSTSFFGVKSERLDYCGLRSHVFITGLRVTNVEQGNY